MMTFKACMLVAEVLERATTRVATILLDCDMNQLTDHRYRSQRQVTHTIE
jgi:hypothetical protein